ncbi:HAD-IB family hydrolase [Ilumatobacter sp.]|uniref:HAD-IB family hydrolase n=1 Tax=Ilumatobacter sp. TaxID=1967498 RepID=UPI002A2D581E|nr:HAD-IB family hydrolase [Ilumatobacter sp.]
MSSDRPHIAAFDVDGTLTTRDCVVPFLRRVAGTRHLAQQLGIDARQTVPALIRRDRNELKARAALAAFADRPVQEVGHHAMDFARAVHMSWLRADTLEMLRSHQAAGDTIVLVSASFEVYLGSLGDLLQVDDVLATRLVIGAEQRFTGALDGPNCRGPEKVRRLYAWLDERHAELGGRIGVDVTAYGDSTGDRELLLDADVPVFVGQHRPRWLPASY